MSLWKTITFAPPVPDPVKFKYYRYTIPRLFYRITNSNLFGSFIMIVILMNTLMLALDRYPAMPKDQAFLMSKINLAFSIIFTLECLMKLIGLGL